MSFVDFTRRLPFLAALAALLSTGGPARATQPAQCSKYFARHTYTSAFAPPILSRSSTHYAIAALTMDESGQYTLGFAPYFSGSHEEIIAEAQRRAGAAVSVVWGGEVRLEAALAHGIRPKMVEVNETSGHVHTLRTIPGALVRFGSRLIPYRPILEIAALFNAYPALVSPDLIARFYDTEHRHLFAPLNAFRARFRHANGDESARHIMNNFLQQFPYTLFRYANGRYTMAELRDKFGDIAPHALRLYAELLEREGYDSAHLWTSAAVMERAREGALEAEEAFQIRGHVLQAMAFSSGGRDVSVRNGRQLFLDASGVLR